MKNICSMKTIAVLFLALFCFMGAHKAFADQLTEYEALMFDTYIKGDETTRPAVRMAFWMDMRQQVQVLKETLPYLVHPNIAFIGIKYDELVSISYTYVVNDSTVDLTDVKNRMVPILCQDPQTMLYLNIFEGDFNYTYFLYGDFTKVWFEFHINASDCGVGI